jgi:hypothetical protein
MTDQPTPPIRNWPLVVSVGSLTITAWVAYEAMTSANSASIMANEKRIARIEYAICHLDPKADIGPCGRN